MPKDDGEVYISLVWDDPEVAVAPRAYIRVTKWNGIKPKDKDYKCGALHLLADYLNA